MCAMSFRAGPIQVPQKDHIHKEFLEMEHRLKAAKRDHNALLIDTTVLPSSTGESEQEPATSDAAPASAQPQQRRGSFLQSHLGDAHIQDVDEDELVPRVNTAATSFCS